jgi:hypothetical protein
MNRPLTRRQLAAVALAPSAAAQIPVQQSPPDELAAVRAQVKETTERLRKLSVPVLLDPAFVFRP